MERRFVKVISSVFALFAVCFLLNPMCALAAEATADSITTLEARFLPDIYYEDELSDTKYRAANGLAYELKKDDKTAKVTGFDPSDYTWVEATDSDTISEWKTDITVDTSNLAFIIPSSITVGGETYVVTEIKASAFSSQTDLKEVKISEGIKVIGSNAFHGTNLETVKIPASVDTIGERVFSDCNSLVSAEFAEGTKLKTIGDYTFDECIKLSSVIIPEGIETIGTADFRGTAALKNITLPDSLISIGDLAFDSVDIVNSYVPDRHNHSALESITIPAGVTSIGDSALTTCENLATITVKTGNTTFYVGEEDGFLYKNDKDKKILVAYPHAKKLTSIIIPADVTLSRAVFSKDENLTSAVFEGNDVDVAMQAFAECSKLSSVTFKGSVNSIDFAAFSGCATLSSVTFNKSVKSIGESAFAKCTLLKTITLPAGIQYVATSGGAGQGTTYASFLGCTALETVKVSKYAQIGIVNGQATSITKGISNEMFDGCTSLKEFEVVDDAESIGYTSTEQEDYYNSAAGVLFIDTGADYDKDDVREVKSLWLMAYPQGNERTSYEVSAAVDNINSYAFTETKNLKTVTFADASSEQTSYKSPYEENVTYPLISFMQPYAFYKSGIETLTTNIRLWKVSQYAFSYCEALKSVTLAENAQCIEGYSFSNCDSLETVSIPDTVTEIDSRAFMYCKALKNVNLPKNDTYTKLMTDTFYNCDALKTITIPENVTEIAAEAIYYCGALSKIVIESNACTINEDAFYYIKDQCEFWVAKDSVSASGVDAAKEKQGTEWKLRYPGEYVVEFVNSYYNETVAEYEISNGQRIGGDRIATLTATPVRGMIFKGWYDALENGREVTAETVVNDDMTVYAIYENDPDFIDGYINIHYHEGGEGGQAYNEYIRDWNSDVTTKEVGGGKFEYDEESNVLTMTNVNWPNMQLIIDGMGDLTLKVVGTNKINSIQKIKDRLIINGTANDSLTLTATDEPFAGQTLLLGDSSVDISKDVNVILEKGKANTLISLPTKENLVYSSGVSPDPVFVEAKDGEGNTIGWSVTNDKLVFGPQSSSGGNTTGGGSTGDGTTGGGSTGGNTSGSGTTGGNTTGGTTTGDTTSQTQAPVQIQKDSVVTDTTTGATYKVTETAAGSDNGKAEVEYKPSAASTETKVEIPSTVNVNGVLAEVTSIADDAFAGNKTLTEIKIPETVEEIGDNAFNGCTGLTSVNIPESVTTIGTSAFQGCTKIKTVTITKGVKTIGKNAFAGCSNVTTVTIKTTAVTAISQGAFKNCKKLKKITITKNVTTIAKDAFSGDKKLTTITIKSNKIKSIGKNAFKNVSKSAVVKLPKLNAKQKKAYKKMLKSAGFKGKIK